MIILEGPDGGGKTTLANRLHQSTGLPLHSRASDSLTGPVKDLFGWAVADLTTWGEQPLSIYDRHPLTSEHIYGPHVRGQVRPGFEMANKELANMRRFLRDNALVIICLPPFETVQANIENDENQMLGVKDNIQHIYDCYFMMLHIWPLDTHICRYNYEQDDHERFGYNAILAAVKHHQFTWRKQQYVAQT